MNAPAFVVFTGCLITLAAVGIPTIEDAFSQVSRLTRSDSSSSRQIAYRGSGRMISDVDKATFTTWFM
jgi:hypothetical protein